MPIGTAFQLNLPLRIQLSNLFTDGLQPFVEHEVNAPNLIRHPPLLIRCDTEVGEL